MSLPVDPAAAVAAIKFQCDICGKLFAYRYTLNRHRRLQHDESTRVAQIAETFSCALCKKHFSSLHYLQTHWQRHEVETAFELRQSAFRKSCTVYRRIHNKDVLSLDRVFALVGPDLVSLLQQELLTKKTMKCSIICMCTFLKFEDGEDDNNVAIDYMDVALRTQTRQIFHQSSIGQIVRGALPELQARCDDIELSGSGWVLDRVLFTDLELGKCGKIRGSCSNRRVVVKFAWQMLLPRKKGRAPPVGGAAADSGTVERNDCFLLATAHFFLDTEDRDKLTKFAHDHVNVCVSLPVAVSSIDAFERGNPALDVRFSVLHIEGPNIYPIYRSKNLQFKNVVHLALVESFDAADPEGKVHRHYAHIVNVDSFLRRTYVARKKTGQTGSAKPRRLYEYSVFYCLNCLQHYSSKRILSEHETYCTKNEPVRIILPPDNETVQFAQYGNTVKAGLFAVFDLETVNRSASAPEGDGQKCQKCDEARTGQCLCRSKILSYMDVVTYCLAVFDADNAIVHLSTFSAAENVVDTMLEEMLLIEPHLRSIMQTYVDRLPLSETDENAFRESEACYLCGENYTAADRQCASGRPVRDHCHRTNLFLGKVVLFERANFSRHDLNRDFYFYPRFRAFALQSQQERDLRHPDILSQF